MSDDTIKLGAYMTALPRDCYLVRDQHGADMCCIECIRAGAGG